MMRATWMASIGTVLLGLAAGAVNAAPITVVDGDFETSDPGNYTTGNTTAFITSPWFSTTGNNSDNSWGAQRPGAPAGNGSGALGTNTYAYMWRTGNNQSIFQNLGVAAVAGTTYTLSGYIKAVDASTAGSIRWYDFSNASGGSPNNFPNGLATSSVVSYSAAGQPWVQVSVDYTPAVSGGFLGVGLFRNSGNSQTNLFFDEITASSVAAPEPAGVVALSAAGLAFARRRRSITR